MACVRLRSLNGNEWQSLPLVAEWHLITKSRPVIKQSLIALLFHVIQGAARMPFSSQGIVFDTYEIVELPEV